MKFAVFKFTVGGVLFGVFVCLLFSYLNYGLLIENEYINPRIIAVAFVMAYFLIYSIVMPSYYCRIFQVTQIKKTTFLLLALIPLVSFSLYLGVLMNLYYELLHTNYKINKTSFYATRTISEKVGETDLDTFTQTFMQNVLDKEGINTGDFEFKIQLPNETSANGNTFVLSVYDKRGYEKALMIGLVPFSPTMKWNYLYSFVGEKKGYSEIKYSTPYGEFTKIVH